jgi:hypothetical protein
MGCFPTIGVAIRLLAACLLLFLPLLAGGCYAGAAAIVLGLLALSERDEPRSPTLVSDLEVALARSSPAVVSFVLTDAESDPADVECSYALDGTWAPLLLLEGPLRRLSTSPGGTRHAVRWDFASQLGSGYREGLAVSVRVAGGAQASREGVALGNDPPQVQLAAEAELSEERPPIVGLAAVPLELSDSSDDIVSILVSYRLAAELEDDAAWKLVAELNARTATACRDCFTAACSDCFAPEEPLPCPLGAECLERARGCLQCFAVSGVEAPRGGKRLDFIWDVVRDLGHTRRDVQLRFVPFDGLEFGPELLTPPFPTDNNDDPQVELIPIGGASDRSFEIPIRFLLRDANEDAASVILQWAAEGEAFPALDSLRLEDEGFLEGLLTASDEEAVECRRGLRILTPAPIRLRGRLDDVDDVDAAGERIRETDFVRSGLVFVPPEREAVRPLPEPPFGPGSEVFLIGQELKFRELEADGSWSVLGASRIVEFDPARSEAKISPPAPAGVRGGTHYELEARHSTYKLASSRGGLLHTLIWDSEEDLSAAGVPLNARVKLRAVAVDTERGPPVGGQIDTENNHLLALRTFDFPGGVPRQFLVVDIDGDAQNEIVLVNDVGLLVFSRTSTVEQATVQQIALDLLPGSSLRSAVFGDLGGDRPMAAMVVRSPAGDDILSIFRNHREEVIDFRLSHSLGPIGTQIVAIALGDVCGDGALELVAAGGSPPLLSVFREPGAVPRAPQTMVLQRAPTALIAADLDDDGRLEIICGGGILSSPNWLQVIYACQDGAMIPTPLASPGLGSLALTAGRFGPQSAMRVAAASSRSDTVALFRLENGELRREPELRTGASPVGLAAAELDTAGGTDLIVATQFSAQLAVHLQGQTGLRPQASYDLLLPAGIRPSVIAAGDLNGDGLDDCVAAGLDQQGRGTGILYFQAPSGSLSFREPSVFLQARGVKSLSIADLDGDGLADLMLLDDLGGGNIKVHTQTILGTLSQAPAACAALDGLSAPRDPAQLAAAGDLDGDGRNDIAVAGSHRGKMRLFRGLPSGSRQFRRERCEESSLELLAELDGPPNPRGVAIADLTGDGRNDVVVAGAMARWLTLHAQEKNGRFAPPSELPVVGQPLAVVVADFDGDGLTDLGVLESLLQGGGIHLHMQMAEGGPAPGAWREFPETHLSLAAGDFNADGELDILLLHRGGGLVFHQSGGTFPRVADRQLTVSANARAVSTGDFNGDGRTDVAIAGVSSTRILVYYQGPAGELGVSAASPRNRLPNESFGTVLSLAGMVSGDLNGDGKDDLASLFGDDAAVYLAR